MYESSLGLNDVVLFEIPVDANVDRFRARLRSRWPGWSKLDEDVWLVAAEVDDDAALAVLLREAQALLPELKLQTIRFCVDDCVYDLKPALKPAKPRAGAASTRRRKPLSP
jgi:hypothetical protein